MEQELQDTGLDSGGEAQGIDMDYGPARASQSQPELFLTECDMLVDCS